MQHNLVTHMPAHYSLMLTCSQQKAQTKWVISLLTPPPPKKKNAQKIKLSETTKTEQKLSILFPLKHR